MKDIKQIQDEIIDDFSLFDDWMGKYEHLIEFGKSLESLEEKYKTDNNLVKGCQSNVWLHTEMADGKLLFFADSDAIITKGIIGLLVIAQFFINYYLFIFTRRIYKNIKA